MERSGLAFKEEPAMLRKSLLASVGILLASAGLSFGQDPLAPPAPPPGPDPNCPLPPPAAVGHILQAPETELCCGQRGWFEAEYLFWWLSNPQAPFPLVTSSTNGGNGTLGQAGTVVLLGDGGLNADPRSGGRGTAGIWFDNNNCYGLEVSGFGVGTYSSVVRFQANSTGSPTLSIPFFNTKTDTEAVYQVASPGISTGSIQAQNVSRLFGGEASFVLNNTGLLGGNGQLLVGFRYAGFEDTFDFVTNQTPLPILAAGPLTDTTNDHFGATNSFYGGQIGWRGEWCYGKFSARLQAKVALGFDHEVLTVGGTMTQSAPGLLPVTIRGGFFGGLGNIGQYVKDEFAVIPEGDVKVCYHFNKHWSVNFGYSFLYWNEVMRGIDQLNRQIDPRAVFVLGGNPPVITPGQPAIPFHETSIWAQGLSAGLEWRF
jgi:hypothetical protein